jgi:hypothetical protein
VTGRWTGRGLCLTGHARSVLRVCARVGLLIGRGGASSHSRPDAFGRCESLLDSNRTLALWRPVRLSCASGRCFAGALLGLTSASGQLRDQRVQSSVARPVNSTRASGRASCMGGVRTCASGQRDCSRIECLTALFERVHL